MPHFSKLEREIRKHFKAEEVKIEGEMTPLASGNFEVRIVGGSLLHSKRNGDGFVDSEAKMKKIIDGIQAALAQTATPQASA